MYLHLTADSTDHDPHIGIEFLPEAPILVRVNERPEGPCDEPGCTNNHPPSWSVRIVEALALHEVDAGEFDGDGDAISELIEMSPGVEMVLTPDQAAFVVARLQRSLADRPELLAKAHDYWDEVEAAT